MKLALFSYGFRPFFLLTGLYAVIAVAVWLLILISGTWPVGSLPPYLWHGHEMIFGFVAAAIAGFLLTAVPSWTAQPAIAGWPLAGLALIWIAGRVVMAFHVTLPPVITAIVDLAFFPFLGLLLTPALLRGKVRNMVFLLFLASLFVANLVFHIAVGRGDLPLASLGLLLGVNTILLIVTIIGGRIVPAFTLGAMRSKDSSFTIRQLPALDHAAIFSILVLLIIDLVWPYTNIAGWMALLAAVIHAVRFARWKSLHTVDEAIVWILHAGYAWVVIGLALKGIYLLTDSIFSSAWLHAFTTGAFATMMMGVMTRAALGHTGRPLVAPPLIVTAYVLISLAAIIRVTGPVFPAGYIYGLAISGLLWIGAFSLFLIIYTPILILPRADGKSG